MNCAQAEYHVCRVSKSYGIPCSSWSTLYCLQYVVPKIELCLMLYEETLLLFSHLLNWKLDLNFSRVLNKPHDSIQEAGEIKRSWAIFGIDKNSLCILEMYFLYRSCLMIPKISSPTLSQNLGGERKRKVKWCSIPWSIHGITETDSSPRIFFSVSKLHMQHSLSLGAF